MPSFHMQGPSLCECEEKGKERTKGLKYFQSILHSYLMEHKKLPHKHFLMKQVRASENLTYST